MHPNPLSAEAEPLLEPCDGGAARIFMDEFKAMLDEAALVLSTAKKGVSAQYGGLGKQKVKRSPPPGSKKRT